MPSKLLTDSGFGKLRELNSQCQQAMHSNWLSDDLHKWTFWLNLAALLIPIIILWIVVDRRRFLEIFVFGMLMAMLVTFLDAMGIAYSLWDYPDRFLPISPRLLPIDFITLPFLYMLVYQRFTSWKSYIIASLVLALVFSFILEPVLVWLNLYETINWKYIYSFPIYFIIALLVKWLTGIFVAQDSNYQT
ncbi:MAG: CBO0543 family protein [Syntrophomonas sp.]